MIESYYDSRAEDEWDVVFLRLFLGSMSCLGRLEIVFIEGWSADGQVRSVQTAPAALAAR